LKADSTVLIASKTSITPQTVFQNKSNPLLQTLNQHGSIKEFSRECPSSRARCNAINTLIHYDRYNETSPVRARYRPSNHNNLPHNDKTKTQPKNQIAPTPKKPNTFKP
jgi:hypothetical protein